MPIALPRTLASLIAVALVTHCFAGEDVTCKVTRDVWLSAANKSEVDTNGGKSPKIKLKVWQEYGIIDFDIAALKGKQIAGAKLYVKPTGGVKFADKKRGTDLRWFTVSTVSSDWVEGEGTSYSTDEKGKGATFNEASYKTRPWAFPGSKNWDVILGNGHTLRCDADAGDPKNGWFEIDVDPRLVQALVAQASYGLLLMDGSTGVDRNSYIASLESGNGAPYLKVTVEGEDTQPPAKPAGLKIEAAPNEASASHGAATISLTVPQDAFAYRVTLNGKPLERWQTPFAGKAGATQSWRVRYLEPGAELNVEVAAVDAAGNVGEAVSAKGKASPKIETPGLPATAWSPKGGAAPVLSGKLKVWAYPEICKLDPLTGQIVLEKGMEDAEQKNSVWDAGGPLVRVASARGEVTGFNLALHALGDAVGDIEVAVEAPEGIAHKLWWTWFVKAGDAWQAEYAIPVQPGQKLAVPMQDKLPGQKALALTVNLVVPESAKPGEHAGSVTVKAAGAELKLALKLKVYEAAIPKEIHFNPELNCYGGPGKAGSEMFFDSFRVAHFHRCTINRVPYGQSGNTNEDWVPAIGPDGKVTDWSNFDKNLGPLLDGSAFKDNPRAGVPVPCLYLPLNENWPLSLKGNYNPGAPTSGADWKARHDIAAKPPEESFSEKYKQAWIDCTADFVKHFEEKGWTRTWAQAYLNNKYTWGKDKLTGSAWVMDEPFETLDWIAIAFYSRLFHKGMEGQMKKTTFQFRGDISRPMWQGSSMDGLMEVMYVGGVLFSVKEIVRDQKDRMPTVLYAYGACNKVPRANHESAAWCLKSYVTEADGCLPWSSIGKDDSFDKANDNGLIVDGSKRFGVNAVASYRVHALRVGAQLVELLRILQARHGWGRAHIGDLVGKSIPMGSEFKQAFSDDAAALTFQDLNGDSFVKLKEGILTMLAK